MKMIISWNNIDVIEITRKKGRYFSSINPDNAIIAIEDGMPSILLSNIKVISKTIPKFIIDRVPNKKARNKQLKIVSSDESINILEYINTTNCIYVTDKFKVSIQ